MPRPNFSSLSLLLAYLFVLSAFAVVHALPSPFPVSSSALFQRRADPDPQPCGFDGDDNTYGLGIRLGLYIQWLSNTLCYFLGSSRSEEARSMQGINLSFQASVFGGLLYVTITRGNTQAAGQLYAAEIWVMLSLCLFAGILTANPEFEPSEPVFSTVIHTASQQTVSVLIFWYTVWFVYTGMDQMAHPPCSRYLFSMAKVDMYHWYRVGWKIVVIPCAIMATIIFVASLRMVLLLLKKPEPKSESEKAMEAQISGVKSYSKYILLALTIFKFFVLGFTVASTELIIRWNHIQNVNSIGGTGQLIPLIVACLAFIRLLYKFFTDFKNRSPSPIVGSQVDPKVDVGVPAKPEDPDKSA